MKESSRPTAIQPLNLKERRGKETRLEKQQQLLQLQECLPILKMYLNKLLKIILNLKINHKCPLLNSKNKRINKLQKHFKVNNKKNQNNKIHNNNSNSNNRSYRINRSKEENQKIKRKKEEVLINK